MPIAGKQWKPGQRWWGPGLDGERMEVDLVAESLDGESLLLGEAKWASNINIEAARARLRHCAANFPQVKGRELVLSYWLKERKGRKSASHIELQPREVLSALR
jgi:hypothetical protein